MCRHFTMTFKFFVDRTELKRASASGSIAECNIQFRIWFIINKYFALSNAHMQTNTQACAYTLSPTHTHTHRHTHAHTRPTLIRNGNVLVTIIMIGIITVIILLINTVEHYRICISPMLLWPVDGVVGSFFTLSINAVLFFYEWSAYPPWINIKFNITLLQAEMCCIAFYTNSHSSISVFASKSLCRYFVDL